MSVPVLFFIFHIALKTPLASHVLVCSIIPASFFNQIPILFSRCKSDVLLWCHDLLQGRSLQMCMQDLPYRLDNLCPLADRSAMWTFGSINWWNICWYDTLTTGNMKLNQPSLNKFAAVHDLSSDPTQLIGRLWWPASNDPVQSIHIVWLSESSEKMQQKSPTEREQSVKRYPIVNRPRFLLHARSLGGICSDLAAVEWERFLRDSMSNGNSALVCFAGLYFETASWTMCIRHQPARVVFWGCVGAGRWVKKWEFSKAIPDLHCPSHYGGAVTCAENYVHPDTNEYMICPQAWVVASRGLGLCVMVCDTESHPAPLWHCPTWVCHQVA